MVGWGVSEIHQQHKKSSINISASSSEACDWLVLGADLLNCLLAKHCFQCVQISSVLKFLEADEAEELLIKIVESTFQLSLSFM